MSELRAAILEAARRSFLESGYHGASIRRIARECSCNVASVYYHFGSKDGLFAEVFARYSPITAVAESLERDPPPPGLEPLQAMRHLAGTVHRTLKDHLPMYYLILTDIREFGGANLRLAMSRRVEAATRDAPSDPVGAFLSRLPLRPGLDATSFIRLLMVSIFSVVAGEYLGALPNFLGGQVTPDRQLSTEETLDQVCETLLYGALAPVAAGEGPTPAEGGTGLRRV